MLEWTATQDLVVMGKEGKLCHSSRWTQHGLPSATFLRPGSLSSINGIRWKGMSTREGRKVRTCPSELHEYGCLLEPLTFIVTCILPITHCGHVKCEAGSPKRSLFCILLQLSLFLATAGYHQLSVTRTLGTDSGMGSRSPEEEQRASDACLLSTLGGGDLPTRLHDCRCSNL